MSRPSAFLLLRIFNSNMAIVDLKSRALSAIAITARIANVETLILMVLHAGSKRFVAHASSHSLRSF